MTERLSSRWWVVTDLDGTLLDHAYDWTPAETALRWLQQRGIPVIPCTSKTAEEVREFRAAAQLNDPYIVENGGAIHGSSETGEDWEEALGPGWTVLKPQLSELARELGEPLQPLDELTDEEEIACLDFRRAIAAGSAPTLERPFVPPSPQIQPRLEAVASARGLAVVRGNRMCHLLGADVSKGRALNALRQRLGSPG